MTSSSPRLSFERSGMGFDSSVPMLDAFGLMYNIRPTMATRYAMKSALPIIFLCIVIYVCGLWDLSSYGLHFKKIPNTVSRIGSENQMRDTLLALRKNRRVLQVMD